VLFRSVVAIQRSRNDDIVWFPEVTTCLEWNDKIYYAAIDGHHRLADFEREVVRGDRTLATLNVVELTPTSCDFALGSPRHLHDCAIGGAGDRSSDRQGALYLRNAFRGLAIHLIKKLDGPDGSESWVRFPGPKHILQERERLFMVCGLHGRLETQESKPKIEQVASRLMDPVKFSEAVDSFNSSRPGGPQVRLPTHGSRRAGQKQHLGIASDHTVGRQRCETQEAATQAAGTEGPCCR